MTRVHVRFTRERDQGRRGNGRFLASSRGWTITKCIRQPSGYSSPRGMGSGGMWLRAMLRCRRRLFERPEMLRGGGADDSSTGDEKEHP